MCWSGVFADLKRDCCHRLKRQNRGGSTRSFSTSGALAQRGGKLALGSSGMSTLRVDRLRAASLRTGAPIAAGVFFD